MPFKYPDLKGSGRDVIVGGRSLVSPQITGLPNTQGTILLTSGTASPPPLYVEDPTGFFAPIWTTGTAAISFAIPVIVSAGTVSYMLLGWGTAGASYILIYLNASEQIDAQVLNSSAGATPYISSTTTAAVSAGARMIHVEINTGTTRQVNIWVDNSVVGQNRNGPNGTPYTAVGTERLALLSHTHAGASSGNNLHAVGGVGFKRGKYTTEERQAHLQAMNIAA